MVHALDFLSFTCSLLGDFLSFSTLNFLKFVLNFIKNDVILHLLKLGRNVDVLLYCIMHFALWAKILQHNCNKALAIIVYDWKWLYTYWPTEILLSIIARNIFFGYKCMTSFAYMSNIHVNMYTNIKIL